MSKHIEDDVRVVVIKESILADNREEADELRSQLARENTFMLNVMGSPGAGKTTLLIDTFKRLSPQLSVGVVEGDIASTVDARRMLDVGIDAVQLRTGGACHIDIPMVRKALQEINEKHDILAIENVGNLVCPAEFDTGAHVSVVLQSIPEGYDKVLKYPLMFTVADALLVTKCDMLPYFDDYRIDIVREAACRLNPNLAIFEVSAKTGAGMDEWVAWLTNRANEVLG